MSDLLASIEGTALAVWTRESPSIWAYPTILTLHTCGLAIVAGANAVIDFRLLGVARGIPLTALRALFPVMWWACALNFATGVVLFTADATTKSGQRVFHVKLAMIAFALIASVSLSGMLRRQADAIDGPAARRLRLVAMASLALWTAAIVAGRLLAYQ